MALGDGNATKRIVDYSYLRARSPLGARPDRFFHFNITFARDASIERDVKPAPTAPPSEFLGRQRFGQFDGRLYHVSGISYHAHHDAFYFEYRRSYYLVSLHGWNSRRQSIATLSAAVRALGP